MGTAGNSKRASRIPERSKADLAQSEGDFYVPGFSRDFRTGLVPGAPDTHRRRFLERAAIIEPQLLETLRAVAANDEQELASWAQRWRLTDQWCIVLARDTIHWWASQPDSRGWEFQATTIFVGNFPFPIQPLILDKFYYDPTWRRRGDFKRDVLDKVAEALNHYCHRVETDALAAGLKRSPKKREIEHFDWLARYQVKGESFASIAQNASYKFKGGRQTVRKAVVELAELSSSRAGMKSRSRAGAPVRATNLRLTQSCPTFPGLEAERIRSGIWAASRCEDPQIPLLPSLIRTPPSLVSWFARGSPVRAISCMPPKKSVAMARITFLPK